MLQFKNAWKRENKKNVDMSSKLYIAISVITNQNNVPILISYTSRRSVNPEDVFENLKIKTCRGISTMRFGQILNRLRKSHNQSV